MTPPEDFPSVDGCPANYCQDMASSQWRHADGVIHTTPPPLTVGRIEQLTTDAVRDKAAFVERWVPGADEPIETKAFTFIPPSAHPFVEQHPEIEGLFRIKPPADLDTFVSEFKQAVDEASPADPEQSEFDIARELRLARADAEKIAAGVTRYFDISSDGKVTAKAPGIGDADGSYQGSTDAPRSKQSVVDLATLFADPAVSHIAYDRVGQLEHAEITRDWGDGPRVDQVTLDRRDDNLCLDVPLTLPRITKVTYSDGSEVYAASLDSTEGPFVEGVCLGGFSTYTPDADESLAPHPFGGFIDDPVAASITVAMQQPQTTGDPPPYPNSTAPVLEKMSAYDPFTYDPATSLPPVEWRTTPSSDPDLSYWAKRFQPIDPDPSYYVKEPLPALTERNYAFEKRKAEMLGDAIRTVPDYAAEKREAEDRAIAAQGPASRSSRDQQGGGAGGTVGHPSDRVKVSVYLENGTVRFYYVKDVAQARDHASAIVRSGYRAVHKDVLNELTWWPPHKIEKVKISGALVQTNYTDEVEGT